MGRHAGHSGVTAGVVVLATDDIPSACRWLLHEAGIRAEQIGVIPAIDNDFMLWAAEIAAWRGEWERAARLLGAAANSRGKTTPLRSPPSWALYKHYVSLVCQELDQDRRRALRDAGRAMADDEALAYALDGLREITGV